MHARARFCCPRAVALALTVSIHHLALPCVALEHHIAVRLKAPSAKPGMHARGKGTNKAGARQGRGNAGELQTALRAHRAQDTH